MAENWIRVRSNLSSAKVALRLAPLCKGGAQHASGVLQDFWSNVKDNTDNGYIGDASDEMLEKWANWTGKRGAFAAWVRAHHMEEDGRVPEWDDYMGELEFRREKARLKKARQRASRRGQNGDDNPSEGGGSPPPVPGDVPGTTGGTSPSYGTERDGTGRIESKSKASSPPARERESEPEGVRLLLDVLGPTQRLAMRASLNMMAQGYDLPNDTPKRPPTDAEFDRACRECAASVQAGEISARVVGGYIARVMRGEIERPQRAASTTKPRTALEIVRAQHAAKAAGGQS